MDTQEEIYNLLQQIADDLIALPGKLLLAPNQIKIDTGLSDMSETLGMIQAGEFRSGNGKEPNMGFSGIRTAYPPMSYNSTNWNLVGIENDVLQFGVRASDGKLIAGGGAVVLDTSGITATAGTIGGWTINATTITGANITLDSTGSIQAGFVSNVSGWRILQDGTAEFNNISVRGEIKSAVFTYDSVQAMAGSMGVFKSAGVVMTDAVVPADATNFNVDIDDPAFGHFQLFAVNDLVRVKFGTTSTWFKVMVATDMTTFWRYALSKQSGTASYTLRAGTPVVDYGVAGDGIIWMTADDANGPFISVVTHNGAPWTTQTEQVRIGNMAGIGSLTGYGWAVGNPSLAQYAYYTPATGLFIKGEVNATAGWFGNSDTRVDAYGVRIFSGVNEVARLGNLNTYLGYVTDVYGLGIGQVGVNKPNLVFDVTNGLRIRNNVTDVLKFDVSGNAIISGKLKMDQTESAIAIGTTPPTSATVGTGIWIDRTGLYGLNASVQQAYLRASDGYMIAGGGKLTLYSGGMRLYDAVGANTSIGFWEQDPGPPAADYHIGRIMGDWLGTAPQDAILWMIAQHQTGDLWNYADIVLTAKDYAVSKEARITLRTDGMISMLGGVVIGAANPPAIPPTGVVWLVEVTAPATPSSTYGALYAKTDSHLYFKNDGGIEINLSKSGRAQELFLSPVSFYSLRGVWIFNVGMANDGNYYAIDYSMNAKHLTIVNSVWGAVTGTAPNRFYAAGFNGTSSYGYAPVGGTLLSNYIAFGGWVYVNSYAQNHGFLRIGTTTVAVVFLYYQPGNYWEMSYYDTGGTQRIIGQIAAPAAGWVYLGGLIAWTASGNNWFVMRVNSTDVSLSNQAWPAPRNPVGNIEFGRSGAAGTYYLNGMIATAWMCGNIYEHLDDYYYNTKAIFGM